LEYFARCREFPKREPSRAANRLDRLQIGATVALTMNLVETHSLRIYGARKAWEALYLWLEILADLFRDIEFLETEPCSPRLQWSPCSTSSYSRVVISKLYVSKPTVALTFSDAKTDLIL
jgi:hypothetical protein